MADVFAEAKRLREDWAAAEDASDAMDGAFLATQCPDCHRSVNALIRDDDAPWIGLMCPNCTHEWTERRA